MSAGAGSVSAVLVRGRGLWGAVGGACRGARRCRGGSQGECGACVGDAEVGEAREVDGGSSGGEPEVVGGDASVGDASGLVAGEPRDGAFGHGAVLAVGGLGCGLCPAGLVGLSALVVFVDVSVAKPPHSAPKRAAPDGLWCARRGT